MTREFGELSGYSDAMLGKRVTKIKFNPDADEGLVIIFDDETVLKFGFSGREGTIEIFRSASMPEPAADSATSPAIIMPPKYTMGQLVKIDVTFCHNNLLTDIECVGAITGIKQKGMRKDGTVWYVYNVFVNHTTTFDTLTVDESEIRKI